MPVEAIHLSAFEDTLTAAPALVRRMIPRHLVDAGRAGALFVDLPYFHGFARGLVRYVLGTTQAPSRWGDIFHREAPIRVAIELGEAGARLTRTSSTVEAGEWVRALALGYVSHAALDTALHPLINRLAAERAAALSDSAARQHGEVEKIHSVLFHAERYGFDFLGTPTLGAHIHADFSSLVKPGPVRDAVHEAITRTLGRAPPERAFAGWARGYQQFRWILVSPLGKRVCPRAEQERERAATYDAVDFPRRYQQALLRSRAWVEAMAGYLDAGVFDEEARTLLHCSIPEQTLDPGPEALARVGEAARSS